MREEKWIKGYIIFAMTIIGMLISDLIINLMHQEWYSSLISIGLILLNVFLVRKDFKKLTLKKE